MAINTSPFHHLYPFAAHYLNRNGLRYHYLDEGRGEPLVMLHGNPTWSFYYRRLVLGLRHRHRIIVPDHMGCGLSDKPDISRYDFRLASRVADLTALLDHLALEHKITLVLHDWGGMIGLAWALDHLDQVARIVITNTAGFFPPRGKRLPWRLRLIRRPNAFMRWAVLRLNLFARTAIYMAPRRPLPAEVKMGLLAPYNCPRHRLATLHFVHDIPLCASDPSGALVARVERNLESIGRRPVLVLWGGHDFVFDQDYYLEWRRRLPRAKAYWCDDAGHYLMEDIPGKALAVIGEFLRNTPGR